MSMNDSPSREHPKCDYCRHPLVDPVSLSCDHKFCAKRVEKESESFQSCPNCRQPTEHLTSELTIAAASKIYRNWDLEHIIEEAQPRSWINLANRQLVDQDMDIVAEQAIIVKQCTELDLGSNRITSQDVLIIGNALCNNTTIKRLYLSDNQLADDGIQHLALSVENSTLFVLGLSKNGITDKGAQYLGEMLKRNRLLTVLGLEDNEISDQGVKELANALKYNNNLQRLLLAGNKMISDSSVDYLVNMLQYNRSLKKLDLRACNLSNLAKAKLQQLAKTKINFELLN